MFVNRDGEHLCDVVSLSTRDFVSPEKMEGAYQGYRVTQITQVPMMRSFQYVLVPDPSTEVIDYHE